MCPSGTIPSAESFPTLIPNTPPHTHTHTHTHTLPFSLPLSFSLSPFTIRCTRVFWLQPAKCIQRDAFFFFFFFYFLFRWTHPFMTICVTLRLFAPLSSPELYLLHAVAPTNMGKLHKECGDAPLFHVHVRHSFFSSKPPAT